MTAFVRVFQELAGLFVDDGSLALAILGIVAFAASIAALTSSLWAGAALLVGCLGILPASVISAVRRHRTRSAAHPAEQPDS